MFISQLITAQHHAAREGHKDVRSRIQGRVRAMVTRGLLKTPPPCWQTSGQAVKARVDHGQWIADCECGGAEAVDPNEPVFYCFSCGNQRNGGYLREVIFPPEQEMINIELLLLERPMHEGHGLDVVDRVFRSRPMIMVQMDDGTMAGLDRSWNPGETIADLQEQNLAIGREKHHGL